MIDFKCMKTVRTMLDQCHVYSNPSALMNIHFQDKKDWDRAKIILWERNVNMHCQDADGNNILHIICTNVKQDVNCYIDCSVVEGLLVLGANPKEKQ